MTSRNWSLNGRQASTLSRPRRASHLAWHVVQHLLHRLIYLPARRALVLALQAPAIHMQCTRREPLPDRQALQLPRPYSRTEHPLPNKDLNIHTPCTRKDSAKMMI